MVTFRPDRSPAPSSCARESLTLFPVEGSALGFCCQRQALLQPRKGTGVGGVVGILAVVRITIGALCRGGLLWCVCVFSCWRAGGFHPDCFRHSLDA